MQEHKQIYRAIIWKPDPDQPGERITVLADDLDEARKILEEQYGKDSVFYLYSEDDADKPR